MEVIIVIIEFLFVVARAVFGATLGMEGQHMATVQKVPGVIRTISLIRNRRPWKQGGGGLGGVSKKEKGTKREIQKTKENKHVLFNDMSNVF